MSGCVLPFRSWSVIVVVKILAARLWAVCNLYTALYFLHIQIFVNFVFSYDLVLIFIAKAFLFSYVIFKSYSPLSNSRQKHRVWVTKRGCSSVGKAGYRACSGRPLWWVRPGVECKFMLSFLEGPFVFNLSCLF